MLSQIIRDIVAASWNRRRGSRRAPTSIDRGNSLEEFFYNNTGHGIVKWHHYFEIYDRHFERFRGKSPVVVEIGVAMGGSLAMWHHYFGLGTQVVGIDIDPACRQFANESTTILIGDQADRRFLGTVREQVPRIDILIDDGGHRMAQQIATFEELYAHVRDDGVYLCEDMHTSLWPAFGGGYRRNGTFLEYAKSLVDGLYAWHSREPALAVDAFTKSTHGMHFYDSVVVIEKRPITPPRQFMTKGTLQVRPDEQPVQFRP